MHGTVAVGSTALALVALAGCGGGGGGDSRGDQVLKGELVSLSRTQGPGSTANVSIVVRPDRHVVITGPAGSAVSRMGAATYSAMQEELRDAPMAELDAKDDIQLPPAANAYRYTIAYRGRLVHWEQGKTPSPLKRTVSDLSQYFSSAPTSSTPLVRVRRTGGLSASTVTVRVDFGGRASRTEEAPRMRSRSYRLARATLERLKASVQDMELAEVPSSSQPAPADGSVYEISTARRTIRAPQGALPSQLERVVALAEGRAYTG
jgi:hypothetical protein